MLLDGRFHRRRLRQQDGLPSAMKAGGTRDTLLTLLTVTRENSEEREKLLSILTLAPTRRKIAVNILVTEMRRENAPKDFIEAWDALQDDALADRARKIVEDQASDGELDWKTKALVVVILLAILLVVLAIINYLKV